MSDNKVVVKNDNRSAARGCLKLIGIILLAIFGVWAVLSIIQVNWNRWVPASQPTALPTRIAQDPTARPTQQATLRPTAMPNTALTTTTLAVDGKTLAESLLGEQLAWPVPVYQAGGPGFPEDCAGLCWNTAHSSTLLWYGPSNGEEDITQSSVEFGDGSKSAIDRMRDGDVQTVIFPVNREATVEICPRGTINSKPVVEYLREANADYVTGECGRFAIPAGWYVVQGNSSFEQAGFGVRFEASGWSSMEASQIRTYTGYWNFSSTTATWDGPSGVEVLMLPSMVQMMQDWKTLDTVTFTTTEDGIIMFCNGTVTGTRSISHQHGECEDHDVPAGNYTYTAPNSNNRTSAGVSWQPKNQDETTATEG